MKPLGPVLIQMKTRRDNRQTSRVDTSRGVHELNQAPYIVDEFRLFDKVRFRGLFDKVRFRGSMCFVTGRRANGYFALRTLDGTRVHDSPRRQISSCRKRAQATYRKGGRGNSFPPYRRRGLIAKR